MSAINLKQMEAKALLMALFVVALVCGCKKPYLPAVIASDNNYLVVEGLINTGGDSTKIRLSRTVNISDTARTKPEYGAHLYVEDDHNNRFNLTEIAGAVYTIPSLNLQGASRCRLHIVTAQQKEYVSDYTDIIKTPQIDTINYVEMAGGIQLYANTHDATGNVKYFRWDYDETWEFSSYYTTVLKYENDQIKTRAADDNIHYCWTSDKSQQIILGSSAALTKAVISAQPIAYIDIATSKLQRGYSMLLRQYGLTKEAYQYWQKLKKNTESLGSIFDAQPSEIKGNIHAIADPSEPVIGYVSAGTVSSKRIIVDPYYLSIYQPNYYPRPYATECAPASIAINPKETFDARLHNRLVRGDSLLLGSVGSAGVITGYTYAPAECVDCRMKIKGSTNNRPSYWPPIL